MILVRNSFIRLAAVLVLTAGASVLATGVAPDELVKTTAQEVMEIIRNDPDIAAGNTTKVVAIVEAKVLGHFDFERMTRLAVGKNWRDASDDQKSALTSNFRTLLVRTYAVALAQFRDREVEYRPLEEAPSGPEVMVHTLVDAPSGKSINIDYRMIAEGEDWKVYDILVDGVSLVINYRSLFDSTIEQNGVDGLVSLLAEKNAAAGAPAQ